MAKLASAALVLVAVALTGCGGSDETRLEKAEQEFRAVEAKLRPIHAQEEPIFNATTNAAIKAIDLRLEALGAIAKGNKGKARELRTEAAAAEAREDRILQRSRPLEIRSKALTERFEALKTEIESLKGCGKTCRADRDRSAKLGIECVDSMVDAGIEFQRADEVCRKKYPLPRGDILPEVRED